MLSRQHFPSPVAGARVVMLCRDVNKAKLAAAEIHAETGGVLVVHKVGGWRLLRAWEGELIH